MATLTIDMPDDVYRRLHDLSRFKQVDLDQLLEDICQTAVDDFDRRETLRKADNRNSGIGDQGLKNMLDEHFLDVKGLI